METGEESGVGQIFMELASEVRRGILFNLSGGNMKLSELAKKIDTTVQHTHNNVERLVNVGMVEKRRDGALGLTNFGKIMMKQVPAFQFLVEHRDYFQDHSLGNLPLKFERRIGDLGGCTVVRGVVAVLQRWKLMYREAEEYINSAIPQVPVDLIEPLAAKIKAGTKFSYVLPEDAIIPKGTSEITKKVGWRPLLTEGRIERRMVKSVFVATILTDKAASVLFPNLKNETDMNTMFYSEDAAFLEWCSDYFKDVWSTADLFDEKKLQHET